MNSSTRWWLIPLLILLAFVVLSPNGGMFGGSGGPEISYTKFKNLVATDAVKSVTLTGNRIDAILEEERPLGPDGDNIDAVTTRVPSVGQSDIIERLEAQKIAIDVKEDSDGSFGTTLLLLLPWILLVGFYIWFWRRMSGGGSGGGFMGGLGQTKAKRLTPDQPTATFDDVAGQDAAKREVAELIDFLRDPGRYQKLGAEVPHGMLLAGPPGTGKTLMARALAGEASVPFFHMSGSEFIEMVVGVGAARVRETFKEAKKQQPAILFIDEIDAIGRQRGTGMGGGNDEREQTLNQILDEMDGFGGREAVIVVAATNRPDVLDPALLRPGRFDRRLTLELPDRKARRSILEVHTRNMPLAKDVDIDTLAAGTPGYSGADIENLANEAAMLAGRDGKDEITQAHFDRARDKTMMGEARPLSITYDERYRLAVHESGHTAVAHFLEHADPLYKVTIIPRGQALGGTHQLPERERYTMDEPYLKDRLAVMLAGRVMEQEFLGNVSSGADADIRQATQTARAMVARWGMDEHLGPVDLRQDGGNPFLGYEMATPREFSDQTAHEVDEAVRRILREAEDRARKIVSDHRTAIEKLVDSLADEETLNAKDIADCLGPGAHFDPDAHRGERRKKSSKSSKRGNGTDRSSQGKRAAGRTQSQQTRPRRKSSGKARKSKTAAS
jgi:cell division protease FtsH